MAKNKWYQHHDGVQVKDGQRQEGRDQVGKAVEQRRMTLMVRMWEDEVQDIDHACDKDDQLYHWDHLYDEEGWVRDEVYDDDEADLTLFKLILKCNQTLTKHSSLSKDRTQGKEGHDGAEVQV